MQRSYGAVRHDFEVIVVIASNNTVFDATVMSCKIKTWEKTRELLLLPYSNWIITLSLHTYTRKTVKEILTKMSESQIVYFDVLYKFNFVMIIFL